MADGRTTNGGVRPGAGRPSNGAKRTLEQMMDEAWPDERKLDTFRVVAALANAGDVNAFKAVMSYRFGMPKQRIDFHALTADDIRNLNREQLLALVDAIREAGIDDEAAESDSDAAA